jgi:hypothetical protein
MATCPHGKEVCEACSQFLSVPEAVAYRAANPGTTQREAAELAGVTRSAIKHAEATAVTKRSDDQNVTEASCPLIPLGEFHAPSHLGPVIDALRTVKTKTDRQIVSLWVQLNWT